MIRGVSNAVVQLSQSTELLLLVKATLILAVALGVMWLMRTSRASARHLVMATAFAAVMVLPILIATVPAMSIAVPADEPAPARIVSTDQAPARSAQTVDGPIARAAVPRIAPVTFARMIWISGSIAFLVPVASALWRLSVIRRTGLPVARHRTELTRLADARGIALPIELLEHEAVPAPMTFGINRPVIVLPLDAQEWSEAELRRALMHEIEHIQRGDWLMQIVARVVAAFYWFHPLVWTAWRRLCLEAERSCDDAVVISEERADYAEQLVLLAQRMSATPLQPMLGMANRSDLSTRVTAVLDDRLERGRAGFTLAAGTIAAAALIVATVAPVRAIAKVDAAAVSAEDQSGRSTGRRTRALDRALYEAAEAGDIDGGKEMLAAGANPSAAIEGDGNPLIGAARSGSAEIAKLLLDQGADPNGIVEGDGSPLIQAAKNGQLAQVRMLIDRGADVNLAVEGDENPLMNAAEQGSLSIVQLLVEKGADIHARIWNERYQGGGEWRTAVGQARKDGHAAIVRFLESRGARD